MFEHCIYMNGIYVIIGGNLGNRAKSLAVCCIELEKNLGGIIQFSSIYETASWGNEQLPAYLNQVLFIKTNYSPQQALSICMKIEESMGRIREEKWASRIIDIDILFFNDEVIEEKSLTIPHPFLHQRNFVLLPLLEIAPNLIHPILKKSIAVLYKNCNDDLPVKKLNANTKRNTHIND
jgi:2-amino-4-hydroxy-6-hydroxymethyldihydropteridine diphosphokinase